MGTRRKGREYALQTLYLVDTGHMPIEEALTVKYAELEDKKALSFGKALATGTLKNQVDIDQRLVKYSDNWELNRMAALDRNILRLGSYELLHHLDTPVSVIIDEAVEIAKMYSTDDSGKFINGILDKIKNEREKTTTSSNGKNGSAST